MLDVIVKAIFYVVGKLGDLIISPLVSGISVLFPNFATLFYQYTTFITTYILNRIVWVFKFFCVPKLCIDVMISICTASIALMVIVRTYVLIVRLYNRFKP